MTPARLLSTDEVLFHLGRGLKRGAFSGWEAGFARSVLGAARRGGPTWEPSPKQRRILYGLVDSLDTTPLVEPDNG